MRVGVLSSGLMGGKLVAMLMMGPEVVAEYRRRYAGVPSAIASSMAGLRFAGQKFIDVLFGDLAGSADRSAGEPPARVRPAPA